MVLEKWSECVRQSLGYILWGPRSDFWLDFKSRPERGADWPILPTIVAKNNSQRPCGNQVSNQSEEYMLAMYLSAIHGCVETLHFSMLQFYFFQVQFSILSRNKGVLIVWSGLGTKNTW